VGLKDEKYGHAEGINMCFISTNKQPIS